MIWWSTAWDRTGPQGSGFLTENDHFDRLRSTYEQLLAHQSIQPELGFRDGGSGRIWHLM